MPVSLLKQAQEALFHLELTNWISFTIVLVISSSVVFKKPWNGAYATLPVPEI